MLRRSGLSLAFALVPVLTGCIEPAPVYTAPEHRPAEADVPDYDAGTLERLVHEAANDARRRHGLAPCRADAALARAARHHSADLSRTGTFSHTGSDGSTGAVRAERAGVRYRAFGENLYRSTLYASGTLTRDARGVTVAHYAWTAPEVLARQAVEAWLQSPGHRANLLRPGYGRAGTGVALGGDTWTVTMDYAD